ncbi:MAG: DNA phosphorothioation system sulfurtransferase DndC [Acidobacteria bacterium]|nr:DNA phosphorothioation system sulfurtransferase DndC [Acidobacteriota bacterium]
MTAVASVKTKRSAFAGDGLATTVNSICDEIRKLYLWDQVPWVVGYSGGKDSTAILQLVWLAIRELPAEQRRKPIHVISTDTLVEQPVVAAWVDVSHQNMRKAAGEQAMPVTPHKLVPETKDTFWVNLIGKGYPTPRKLFRWCTSRMKINPSNNFIRNVVRENGEAILVLGTRKAESQRRARNMAVHEAKKLCERLTPNSNLPNSLVYTPIEDWTNDDVWLFLMQVKNPWGHTNKSLLGMYQGASADGECPLVVDTSTPSCGSSRFGCWVCTVVDKDRSMEAMIKNDDEKVWMVPLLELRNDLGDFSKERARRDYRRMSGRVQLFHDGVVRGPYTKEAREYWLTQVLSVQKQVREIGPEEFRNLQLISFSELHEIRRVWLYEKHEFEDSLPRIYEEIVEQPFPKPPSDDNLLRSGDWEILREVCGADDAFFDLQAGLLDIERQFRGMSRRAGIYQALEDCLRAGQYANEEEALAIRQDEERRRNEATGARRRPVAAQRS